MAVNQSPARPTHHIIAPAREADDFEQQRQIRETRNEVVINYIRGTLLLVIFSLHLLTRFIPGAPFRSPWPLIAILGATILVNIFLFFYFRGNPPYSPLRKYAISTFEVCSFVLGFAFLRGTVPEISFTLVPISFFMLLVILSGLRYSTGVTVFTGSLTLTLYLAIFASAAPPHNIYPVLFSGTILLTTATVGTSYSVASLIRLHRESVWKERLTRFLPPELVAEIARKPDILQQKTESRVATVLFTDIRGFTTLSERMAPEEVVAFLNLFLEEMTAAIMDQGGMLDKYIGDAVMAVFGVPVPSDDHAARAVNAALAMRERLDALNETLTRHGMPPLAIGIGIHTGEVVVGAIGSTRRLEYTIIGDTVNVTSRIEALTRRYPVDILLSDATRAALEDGVPLQQIATVQVKGREQPVTLWSPQVPVQGAP